MQRLIIILPNNLGDVIMALPVLEAIKAQRRAERISFLVEEGYEGGLLENPFCDRILKFPRKYIKSTASTTQWRQGAARLRSVVEEIRSEGCDAVVNLSQHSYVSYIVAMIDASLTCGRRFLREGNHALFDPWSQYLYAVAFARRYNMLHATDIYCRIAGVTSGHGGTAVKITDDEKTQAAQWLASHGFSPHDRMAVFQPGAAWVSKRWPHDAYIALGKRLIRDGYRIVVTGAESERSLASAIAEALDGKAMSSAGDLSFRETMALLPWIRFVVCSDTAIMHAAAALGVKVYALFGPTNPVETGPYGEEHVVIMGMCEKRPCFSVGCTSGKCMRSVTPDMLYGCISGMVKVDGSCDVFTTGFENGVYRLKPERGSVDSLYDAAGAALTRRAFEPGYSFDEDVSASSSLPDREESNRFAQQCMEMALTLETFLAQRDAALLRRFEEQRAAAARAEGIAAFWTALLNIRLNSVPLLDPVSGVARSMKQCRFTAEQIFQALRP